MIKCSTNADPEVRLEENGLIQLRQWVHNNPILLAVFQAHPTSRGTLDADEIVTLSVFDGDMALFLTVVDVVKVCGNSCVMRKDVLALSSEHNDLSLVALVFYNLIHPLLLTVFIHTSCTSCALQSKKCQNKQKPGHMKGQGLCIQCAVCHSRFSKSSFSSLLSYLGSLPNTNML